MNRSPELQKFVDELSREVFGTANSEALEKAICVICRQPVGEFEDDLSRKEYGISGMCQKCQDDVFR